MEKRDSACRRPVRKKLRNRAQRGHARRTAHADPPLLVERLYGTIDYRMLLHLGPYSRSSIRALVTDTLGPLHAGRMAHIDSGGAIVLVVVLGAPTDVVLHRISPLVTADPRARSRHRLAGTTSRPLALPCQLSVSLGGRAPDVRYRYTRWRAFDGAGGPSNLTVILACVVLFVIGLSCSIFRYQS